MPVEETQTDSSPVGHSTRGRLIGLLQVVGVLVILIVAIGFAREDRGGGRMAAPQPATQRAARPVAVVPATPQLTALRVDATGTVQARNFVPLATQVSGRVRRVGDSLRPGGRFAAGETLLEIDPIDFELRLAQARAELAAALANLELLRAQADAAISNYALLNGDASVPPLVARAPQIAQGEAQIEGARAALATAELALARTRFSLAFPGRVASSSAEVGQLLVANQAFGEAYAEAALEVVVPLAEADLARLNGAVGRAADIDIDGLVVPSRVAREGAVLDDRTRFTEVYLPLPEATHRPGQFVGVTLYGPEIGNVFVLPPTVLQTDDRLWAVREGRLAEVEPTIRAISADSVIVDAFDAGDGIVDGQLSGATPGMAVELVR
ncbi:MAG: hypothetical protein AAF515_03085 [Pseudomonadota bacterium]